MAYKSMYKYELAALAGVCSRTFAAWLRRPHRMQLTKMGVCDTAKVLPPVAVKYLCEIFVIEIEES